MAWRESEVMKVAVKGDNTAFAREIKELCGQDVLTCYQCRKCTMGCPMTFKMKMKVNELMRAIQLGLKEEVLSADTMWWCVSCETCSTRCPQGIEIVDVMDVLREMAYKGDYYIPVESMESFHKVFLRSVKAYGRLYEMGFALDLNLMLKDPLKDADLGPVMLTKGKLKLLPDRVKDLKSVKKIFENVKKLEELGA